MKAKAHPRVQFRVASALDVADKCDGAIREFLEIRGAWFWGPYKKDPTI